MASDRAAGADRALLARLRAGYLERAPERTRALAIMICRAIAAEEPPEPPGEESDLERAIRAAHSMVGTGGSYGVPEVTARARPIERRLGALPDDPAGRREALLAALRDALDLLEVVSRESVAESDAAPPGESGP